MVWEGGLDDVTSYEFHDDEGWATTVKGVFSGDAASVRIRHQLLAL